MTAAIALGKRGVAAEIVELEESWAPAGVGLLLQSPPLRALKQLGLFDACVEAGWAHHELVMCSADGTQIGSLPQTNVNDPGDPPAVAMSRMTLHAILAAELKRLGVRVRLGTTLEELEQDADSARARLTGGDWCHYDLVLGADGLHSQVRARAFPQAPGPRFTGQVIWRAGLERPAALDRYHYLIAGPTRMGLVPLTDERVYIWMLETAADRERPPREELVPRWQERLAAYAGFVPELAEQITRPDQVDFRALQALLVPAPWHAGRVLLVGDAAHTTTPHLAFGVGLAIEDAVVLAELAASDLPLAELLGAFMARRYERCRLVVENSLQLGEWEQRPDTPGADPGVLIGRSFAALAQPA
jgi:2-polyprenyl-6-methoxyphenol hydroxylase-like FAD-dependent oxidoreductase